ncbi:MAG: metallophosphoesterase [Thermoproteales archaeon]|nr:metallophosphoesterase [Thermoproteales archaeon]
MDLQEEISILVNDLKEGRYSLLKEFTELLENTPLIRKQVDCKVVFVGDLHGDLYSLLRLIDLYEKGDSLIVFLGDYVDRGYYQLETLMGVLLLKKLLGDRILLLRGNHEDPMMNYNYGFLMDIRHKLGLKGLRIYQTYILDIYIRLPVAALINAGGRKIFAVHGGIPIEVPSLNEISQIRQRVDVLEDPTLLQLLWNDPLEDVEDYAPNIRGEGIFYYGRKIVEKFMVKNDVDLIVRAHEPVSSGARSMFNGRLYTVFTCRYYGISPSVLEVEPRRILVKKLGSVV